MMKLRKILGTCLEMGGSKPPSMVKGVQTSHRWDRQGHHAGFHVRMRHDGGSTWLMQWDRRLQWLPVNAHHQKGKKRKLLTQHLSPDEETEEDPWHLLGHDGEA